MRGYSLRFEDLRCAATGRSSPIQCIKTQITVLPSHVARGLTNTVDLFVGCSISFYDHEGNVGDEIERQNKHLEQPGE